MNASILRYQRRRAQGERGALLVEALVVIAFFVLTFAGLLFFHAMYGKTLSTSRRARSATMAYALVGCQGDPAAGLPRDSAGLRPAGGGKTTSQVPYKGASASPAGSPEAVRATGTTPGAGAGIGQEIARFGLEASVTQNGATTPLTSTVTSYSYVGCADRVRNSTFDETSGAASAIRY